MSVEEKAGLRRPDRRVGLAEDLPEEWIEVVRAAEVPAEFTYLDDELEEP